MTFNMLALALEAIFLRAVLLFGGLWLASCRQRET
jgi:hypothetical protein